MRIPAAIAAIGMLTGGLLTGAAATAGSSHPMTKWGILNPERARSNWMLKCQGCHRPDASGSPATAPAMAGQIARFLRVPGGREYLGRVPGVATAALSDDQLAELLNWTLVTFDRGHLPSDFEPYSAVEIGRLRHLPLRTDAPATRAALLDQLPANANN